MFDSRRPLSINYIASLRIPMNRPDFPVTYRFSTVHKSYLKEPAHNQETSLTERSTRVAATSSCGIDRAVSRIQDERRSIVWNVGWAGLPSWSGHSRIFEFSPKKVSSPVAPPSACSSPNYVTSSVRTCTSWLYISAIDAGFREGKGTGTRRGWKRGNARTRFARARAFVLLRTAPSSRRTNKRTYGRTYGASLRSKSTDVGALRRRKPCICRPFRPLSPANVGVAEYLLSVPSLCGCARERAKRPRRAASKAFAWCSRCIIPLEDPANTPVAITGRVICSTDVWNVERPVNSHLKF